MRNLYTALETTTGKKLLRNTIGIAALLGAVSVPGYCATGFGFAGTAGSGQTIIVNGDATNETLSSFSAPIASIAISGVATSADDGTFGLTNGTEMISVTSGGVATVSVVGTLTCSLTASCAGNLNNITGSQTWETIIYNSFTYEANLTGLSGFTTNIGTGGTGGQTSFATRLGAASSVTDLAALLTDTGETNTTSQVTAGGTNASNGTPGSGPNYNFTVTSSATLQVALTPAAATPEPVSFLLLGTGLMGIALVARRHRATKK